MNNLDDLNQIPHIAPRAEFHFWQRALNFGVRWITRLIAALLVLSVLSVILLRWINPVTTAFMLQRQWSADDNFKIHYQWTDWENISPHIKMAAITSEDQRFATHWGIDFASIEKAIDEYEKGANLRGASTITQQTAKNLFLWQDQSFIRKGIETYMALLIEIFWSKERILEVYLNVVEFGNGIYGVQAAAQRYFHTSARYLTKPQSALMITALPSPRRYNLDRPSSYMYRRQRWVMRYMDLLGNSYYLRKLQ